MCVQKRGICRVSEINALTVVAFDCRTGDNIGVAADSTDALPVAIPVVISGNVPVNTAEAAHVEHDNTVPTNSFD